MFVIDIFGSLTLNSINDPPIFNDGSFSTDEDITTTYDLSTLTSDEENDLLTYTIITPPNKGSASINGSVLTFIPTLNLHGSDSIEISVSYGNLSSTSTISITINTINDDPVFNDGSFSTYEDVTTTFYLSSLTSDVDSNSLTYIIKTQPSKGIASINDTTLTYISFENEFKTTFSGQISYAIIPESFFIEILQKPPRLMQWEKSLNNNKSPMGTNGAPCPPSATSWTLKSHTIGFLIKSLNSTLFPSWNV